MASKNGIHYERKQKKIVGDSDQHDQKKKQLGVHQGILLAGWAWVGQLHWTMIGAHKNPTDIESNYRFNGHTNRVIFQLTNNEAQQNKKSLARSFFFLLFSNFYYGNSDVSICVLHLAIFQDEKKNQTAS